MASVACTDATTCVRTDRLTEALHIRQYLLRVVVRDLGKQVVQDVGVGNVVEEHILRKG